MLIKISCDKFSKKTISFKQGLNVIQGDKKATNSIGKSNLLMVIDFVFGGTDFIKHNSDVMEELGDHDYNFTFLFDKKYHFKRNTHTPNLVYLCNKNYQETKPIDIKVFTDFLWEKYSFDTTGISFRAYVGLFSRVWGKENLEPKKPMHYFPSQKPVDAIDNMLKRYKLFNNISHLSSYLKEKSNKNTILNNAEKIEVTPKILKKKYVENEKLIASSNQELKDIENNLAKYVTSISEIINKESLELKDKKDHLLTRKLSLQSKLRRIQKNLSDNRHLKGKNLIELEKQFPCVNTTRILEIENFHKKISTILKKEMKEKERSLISELAEINKDMSIIDNQINSLSKNVKEPESIIGRVSKLSQLVSTSIRENEYYDERKDLKSEIRGAKENLLKEREKSTKMLENIINSKVRSLVTKVYSKNRKSPVLTITPTNYSFDTFEDTGTGKAYSNLLIFDLSVFKTTDVPFLIHDSLLFKNIENEAVSNIISIYNSVNKQSFISIDEIDKYGKETAKLLRSKRSVKLSNNRLLYIKDWRKK